MNATDTPTTPTTAAAVMMPGRAVDIIHTAAARAGITLNGMALSFREDPAAGSILGDVSVHLRVKDIPTAQRLFAALGATATVSTPYGTTAMQANVEAQVPALARLVVCVIVTEGLASPEDPTAWIADVDARRAHVLAVDVTQTAGGTDPAPTPAEVAAASDRPGAVTATGERAARFEARFDSVCPTCRQALLEDSPASWLDGDVVHDTCAEVAGITVYDPY